jgi:hypothetical protein
MNPDRQQFLSLRHLPGRLSVEEAAWYLGFSPHEIPRLTKAKLLKPLGAPGVSATKLYSLTQLQRLRDDAVWLSKASDTMYKFWQTRNCRMKKPRRR